MKHSIINLSKKAVSFGIFIVLWQLLSRGMDSFVLPSPLATLEALINYSQQLSFYEAIYHTLSKLFIGLVGAMVIGGGLSFIAGLSSRWKPFLEPIIDLMQSIPPIAWLGIAIIWFGLTDVPSIFIIVLSTTPILFTNLYEGIVNIDAQLLRMANVFQVPRKKVILGIIIPSLRSYLKSGLVTATGLGWKLAVMAELLTSVQGIGSLLSDARTNLDTQKVFALALFMAIFWQVLKVVISLFFRNKAGGSPNHNKGRLGSV
jgi:NitT/TauT family transport system permease protein